MGGEPFTGLGLDRFAVRVEGGEISLLEPSDPILKRGFESPLGEVRPTIGGRPVPLQEAVARAAEILTSGWTLISGLGTDLAGMRKVLELADRIGAVVDPAGGDALFRNLSVLQERGWIATTLSEVKNRADLLLTVGVDLDRDFPSLLPELFTGDGMFVEAGERRLLWIGERATRRRESFGYACPREALFAEVARLKALVEGFPVAAPEELVEIAEALKQARYPVVAWSAASLDLKSVELLIEMVVEMVRHLNLKGRAACLPLGGKNGSSTAQNVTAWQTGYPIRVSFARGYPEYDPYRFSARRLLQEGEVDALLWIEAFDAENPPPEVGIPKVVLGRSGMGFTQPPEVSIPIGTPGIDHPGHLFRMDGTVAIRLGKVRECGLPSASEVLQKILEAVDRPR